MPWSSGVFESLTAPVYPAVSGTTIKSADYNSVINDLVAGLTGLGQCAYSGDPLDYPVGSFGRALSHEPPFGIGTDTPTMSLEIVDASASSGATAIWLSNTEPGVKAQVAVTGSTFNLGGVGPAGVVFGPTSGNANTFIGTNLSGSGDVVIVANAAQQFHFSSDGRIWGTQLHNNTNLPSGSTNNFIASGTYTPTFTTPPGSPNVSAHALFVCNWMRVGNVVTVSGRVDVTPTTTGAVMYWRLSLPIASTNIDLGQGQLGGAAVSALEGACTISGDVGDVALFYTNMSMASSANHLFFFSFTYLVD